MLCQDRPLLNDKKYMHVSITEQQLSEILAKNLLANIQ